MIELLRNTLKDIATTQWLLRPKGFPSITFSILDEYGAIFTDEGEAETEINIQVDIWSKKEQDHINLTNQVKEKLKEIEFYRTYETDDFEEDTRILHKILRFTHLKNNESEV